MKRVVLLILALASLSVLSFPTGAFPEEVPYRLDDIVVTATRTPAPLRQAPANVTVITSDIIEDEGAKTVADALKTEVGVFATNMLNNPKTTTIDIRGYGETAPQNVLVLVDGRRVNSIDMSGPDYSQVPIEMIERIEVYRGPGSVLYGDNAIGGVVNIILKKGEGKPQVTARVNTGSYNLVSPYMSFSGRENRFSYFLIGSSYDTDGYRHNNDYHGRDLGGNLSYAMSDNITFTAKMGHHTDRYGLPGALTYPQLQSGLWDRKDSATPFDKASTEDGFMDLGTEVKLFKDVSFLVNGSYRDRSFTSRWAFYNWETRRNERTYALTPKIVANNEFAFLKSSFIAGFDYYRSQASANDSYVSGEFPSSTNIEKKDYGFYVNDELTILNKLILGLGYRRDKAQYDFGYSGATVAPVYPNTSENVEAFRASANYLFQNGNLFFTYAKGFRLPTTDELFSPLSPIKINNVQPQTAYEFDLGIRWNPFKRVGGSLTLFQIKTDNEIYFDPLTFMNGNYDKTKRHGIETTVNLILTDSLRINMNYTYIKAIFDGAKFSGNDIPFVPRNKFSTKISYSWKDFTFNLIGLYTGNRYMNSDPQNLYPKLPGVTTFDFNIDYRVKGVALYFGAKNITGQRYYEFGTVSSGTRYFYPAPERQFLFGIQYTLGG